MPLEKLEPTLGNKKAGELILAQDWNALIKAIDTRSEAHDQLEETVGDIDERVSALETRVGGLQASVEQAEKDVTELRGQFRRVSLNTTQLTYAIGEQVEIAAKVTGLDGAPIDANSPPFIDFVATWGRLRAHPNFPADGGADDRTLSVRVNAAGEAKVLLRADHTAGLSDDAEQAVSDALATQIIGSERTAADLIRAANTPNDATVSTTFSKFTELYDNDNANLNANAAKPKFLSYVDTYFAKNTELIAGKLPHFDFTKGWRDYRSTVMALVKPDNDPRTPDSSLGACSIQITFRDWIGPWIVVDYLPRAKEFTPNFKERLGGGIDRTSLDKSLGNIQERIIKDVDGKGLVFRQRTYRAIGDALGTLNPDNPPSFIQTLTQSIQDAVSLQQTFDPSVVNGVSAPEGQVVFQVFTNAAAHAQIATEKTRFELTGVIEENTRKLGEQMSKVPQQVEEQVNQKQAVFEQQLFKEGSQLRNFQAKVDNLDLSVQRVNQNLEKKLDVERLDTLATLIKGR